MVHPIVHLADRRFGGATTEVTQDVREHLRIADSSRIRAFSITDIL